MRNFEIRANISTEKGRKAIQDALDTIQKGCTARTLTLPRIEAILAEVVSNVDISNAALKGTRVYYTGAQHFAKAYKYPPECTQFSAVFNGKTWFITMIERTYCPNRKGYNTHVTLSPSAIGAVSLKMAHMSI